MLPQVKIAGLKGNLLRKVENRLYDEILKFWRGNKSTNSANSWNRTRVIFCIVKAQAKHGESFKLCLKLNGQVGNVEAYGYNQ